MATIGIVCKKVTVFNVSACLRLSVRCKRHIYTSRNVLSSYWYKVYHERKKHLQDIPVNIDEKPNVCGVFANNEICLLDIRVYGFDYDYTLASYTEDLHHVLYDLGKEALIKYYKYPEGIAKQNYNPEFAIRGLHYDIRKGLLMKIDSYHNIQLGSVYRGTTKLSDNEVFELYYGTHVPIEDMNTFYGKGPMHQLVDMFAPPELNLITNVTDYFIENNIPYDPEYVFYDIRNAVQSVHSSGLLHETITKDLDRFVQKGAETKKFLERLSDAGKKLFIITNSGFPFIDAGMKHMVGNDWLELFDVVIVQARKPKFFNETSRPFRLYDPQNKKQSWGRVKSFDKGQVYVQGNFKDFRHMTGWYGSKCIYFGDHVYGDLADPSLKHGWRTGAIIPELASEIETITKPDFRSDVNWLIVLQHLLEEMQTFIWISDTVDLVSCVFVTCTQLLEILYSLSVSDAADLESGSKESLDMIPKLLEEREILRSHLKSHCNPRFGSMFRTHHNPTYFSRRMARFADMYMSELTNLLQYSVSHTFYPRRTALPHEPYPFGDPSHSQCSRPP